MSNEVEVMDAVASQNYQAAHSVTVMEQWGNSEVYNEERWIERGRLAVRLDNGNYAYSVRTLQIAERFRQQQEKLTAKQKEIHARASNVW